MPDRIPEDDLTDLERRLAALRPASVGLDRDRMLFEAGRASARAERKVRALAFVAAASAMVTVGLGVGLARERSRSLGLERALVAAREVPSAVSSPAIAPPSLSPSPPREIAPDSYLALSRRAFAGLDELPPASPRHPVGPGQAGSDPTLSPLRVRGAEALRDL